MGVFLSHCQLQEALILTNVYWVSEWINEWVNYKKKFICKTSKIDQTLLSLTSMDTFTSVYYLSNNNIVTNIENYLCFMHTFKKFLYSLWLIALYQT